MLYFYWDKELVYKVFFFFKLYGVYSQVSVTGFRIGFILSFSPPLRANGKPKTTSWKFGLAYTYYRKCTQDKISEMLLKR